ncbi:regulation of nuclear pre-mRNA domain-containing 1B-like isoform X1 [Brachionus plicatilis]|uniref:Regulation of nuclear pre-mRNA domain-containing 1B-like isoform X1 n=1 Tax=Brachionus plicatilis TaxID=10195 RepID=A0A3M7SZ66_BRAPC|nr:regulation of nuclear pre-mRNA domain-containing 1B-like isoform X1 [Brachionus plicatilis]
MSFSEASLQKKFAELTNTQQSVQTLSLWLIHHRKNSKTIVSTWYKELTGNPKPDRKLTLLYLANDILQNSRKKGNEYLKEFSNIMSDAIGDIAKYSDDKTRFTVERILNIWKDRKIYQDDQIEKFRQKLHSTKSLISPEKSPSCRPDKAKLSLREEVEKELSENAGIAVPEPADLAQMLHELESSASSDALVRQKIAALPHQVTDMEELKKLRERNEALELSKMVDDASALLNGYNLRLQQELVNRKQTALKLAAFIRNQSSEIENDEKMISEWQEKVKQVNAVKKELQNHLQSLPDLASIEEAAELVPLPSAGDLFSN